MAFILEWNTSFPGFSTIIFSRVSCKYACLKKSHDCLVLSYYLNQQSFYSSGQKNESCGGGINMLN